MVRTAFAQTPKLNTFMPLTGLRRHATHATHSLQLKCKDARNACQHASFAAAASFKSAGVHLLQHMSALQQNIQKLPTNISLSLPSVPVASPIAPNVQLAPLAKSLWRNAKRNTCSLASRCQQICAAAQLGLERSWTALVVFTTISTQSASSKLGIAMANLPHLLQTTVPSLADAVLQAALDVSDIALASAVDHLTTTVPNAGHHFAFVLMPAVWVYVIDASRYR